MNEYGIDTEQNAINKTQVAAGHRVHHVLVMDEVDGMSGNQDRAGVSVEV